MHHNDKPYTLAAVATDLKLSERTIRQAIHSGHLQASKINGRWRITPAALRTWLRSAPFDPATPEAPTHLAPPAATRDDLHALVDALAPHDLGVAGVLLRWTLTHKEGAPAEEDEE